MKELKELYLAFAVGRMSGIVQSIHRQVLNHWHGKNFEEPMFDFLLGNRYFCNANLALLENCFGHISIALCPIPSSTDTCWRT